MPEKRIDFPRLASMLFCVLVALLGVFLVGKYVVAAVMPFLIALGIAFLLRPAVDFLSERLKLPRKLCAVLLLILLFLLLGLLLTLATNRLLYELGRLVDHLSGESERIGEFLSNILSRVGGISSRIPILKDIIVLEGLETLGAQIDGMLRDLAKNLVSSLTTRIPDLISRFVSSLPSFFLFLIATVIATIYFTMDPAAISAAMTALLPRATVYRLPVFKQNARRFVGKYLRAYLLLLFLTFCELFVGFSVLRVDYAFLLAFLVALVDILPILGVGTVLIPWAVVMFFTKNFRLGLGLLILWCAVTVVRQVIEPRIVGGTFGIHPALTLFGMYVGFRLFGILGMLLAPAALVLGRFLFREYKKEKATSL